jgi:Brp/Blh family beta-carotene 15,15'-monooxygenase
VVQLNPHPDVAAPGVCPQTPGRRAAAELRALTVVPIAAVVLLIAISALAPEVVRDAALPLAAGGALLGVPHGAVDHLVPRWAGMPGPGACLALLVPAYLTVALVAATGLLLAPGPTVLSFLLLSALHFGTAETAFAAERRSESTPSPWHQPLASGAHGAAVIGLLLWVHPEESGRWLRMLAPTAADAVSAARGIGLTLTIALITAGVIRSVLRAQAREIAEIAVLVVLFATVSPLAAFGVYFGCWHALRHTGRLLDVARDPADRDWRPAMNRLSRACLLPSVAALATLAWMVLTRGRAPLLAEVAVLLALTYPHAVVVWSCDSWRHADSWRHSDSWRHARTG